MDNDSNRLVWLEGLLYDLRFALRGLQRDRSFALMAIAMLTLAIALNVVAFTIMDAMLFRGYPLVKKNERLVYLQERPLVGSIRTTYLDFDAWRSQARAFEGMGFIAHTPITLRDRDGRSADISAATVSANTFRLLGVPPMLGRDFASADEVPGAAPVAILDYRFWESRFAKRADIIGLTVHINGAPATVIGVMPEGFVFPVQENLWMPLVHSSQLYQKSFGGYFALGRLRPGVTLQEARAEIDVINRRLDAADHITQRSGAPTVFTFSQFHVGPDAPLIYGSVWAAAGFVLLIACANLANLALARTFGRWREFSTRIALGAGQGRIVRQILMEGLVLAGISGTLAWWITKWSVRIWATATVSRYQVQNYGVDSSTLSYLAAISVAAAILFSVLPIFRIMQLGTGDTLKGDARGVTQSLPAKRLVLGLVVGQMALAIVLLSGAGVLVRSLLKVVDAETGVRKPEHVLAAGVILPSDKYVSPETRLAYFDRIETQLKTIPGIEEATVANTIPVNAARSGTLEIEGRLSPLSHEESVAFLTTGTDYFRVMRAPVITGRDFNDGDQMESLPVAIVNQSFADKFWPGEQSLGKRLRVMDRNKSNAWRIVVGVVPNIMQGDPIRQRFAPLVYIPFQQDPTAPAVNSGNGGFNGGYFLLRAGVPPDQVAEAVRSELQKSDPDVLIEDFMTLDRNFAFRRNRMDLAHAELGKYASVTPIFAMIALLLAALGLGAVIAHAVTQRTKEIGIRMAVGAAAQDIRRMILRDGMLPVAIGMILGFAASLAVNRILQSQLVGVSPYDPVTMVGAPVILTLVALLACLIPSRRAMNVDPTVALRHE